MPRAVYLAGPDVFLPDAAETGMRKKALCREYGVEGLFPLDNAPEAKPDAAAIFTANVALMRRADAGLFNLTPFRGPSADAGTVWELGFMYALGKPLFGYSAVPGDYADRVAPDGFDIERFGLPDNLMIAEAIEASGGTFTAIAEPGSLAAFKAFAACLEAIGAWRSQAPQDLHR